VGKNKNDKYLQEAKNTAYRLLKIRNRSEQEIRVKLKEKDFPNDIIEETTRYLKTVNLIDDRLFAKGFIRSRLNKPFGKRRIVLELQQKGVSKDIIKETLLSETENYDEKDTAINLVRKRAVKYHGIEETKKQQRLFAYLIRRGFSSDSAWKAIKEL